MSDKKVFRFKVIVICAVIALFVVIELVVRIIVPINEKEKRLIDLGELSFFSEISVQGKPYIQITNKYGYSEQRTTFERQKSPNTIRIFCLGGSAAAGWPHPVEERFSTYLDSCLKEIYPNKKIEIINCGAHGFASYRVRQVFHQLLPFQPDAVILWSGNNEFLEDERFTVSKTKQTLDWMAKRIRIVQLFKNALPGVTLNGNEIEATNSFWKKSRQQSLGLCTDSVLARKVRKLYFDSINNIAQEAAENKIKVVLFTVPVNLHDWQPNVSFCSLKGPDSVNWARTYNTGRKALINNEFEKARHFFQEAIKLEPLYAQSYFYLAQTFENLQDTMQAYQSYVKAKDLDYNPFRAISDFNESVKKIAAIHTNVSLFDAEKVFHTHATRGIPGFDLFLDYVHPSRDGNILLATELAEMIRQNNILGLGDSKITVNASMLKSRLSNYCDENDLPIQITRYSLFCLTHQYNSAILLGKWIIHRLSPEYLSDKKNQDEINKLLEGVKAFSTLIIVDKEELFATVSNKDKISAKLAVKEFYDKYFPYGSY